MWDDVAEQGAQHNEQSQRTGTLGPAYLRNREQSDS